MVPKGFLEGTNHVMGGEGSADPPLEVMVDVGEGVRPPPRDDGGLDRKNLEIFQVF